MSEEKVEEIPSKRPGLMEEDETYATAGYKQTAHGFNYQLKMLMLVLYRAYRNYSKFKLATEMSDAGDFDDIVLEYEDKDGRIVAVLIQCKHKADEGKKITLNELCEENGNFGLQRYMNSYINIKKNAIFATKSIKSVILCTNIDIDEQLKTDKRIVVETRNDKIVGMLQFKDFKKKNNSEPSFYKIENAETFEVIKKKGKKGGERIKTELSTNDVEEFEEKFLIALNLPNENELDDIIKKEMGEEFYISDCRATVDRLYSYIHKWMSDRKGIFIDSKTVETFFYELKGEIRKMGIIGAVFSNREKKLEFGDFFKTTADLENMLKPTITYPLVHVKSKSSSLTIIKIVQLLKDTDNYVALSLETLLALDEKVKDTFESKLNFTIYVDCGKIKENDWKRATVVLDELLQKALKSNGKKSIVLVSREKNDLIEFLEKFIPSKLTSIEDCNAYQDFTQSTKERILHYNVNFQGHNIQLREIVNDDCEDILVEEILNKIIEKDQIKIGKPVEMTEELRRIYIRRNLQINLKRLKKKHEDKSEEEIKEIAKAQSENQICIIEGGPGIGKSTALTNMAFKEKNENKSEFVLSVNLLDYSSEFDEVKEFGEDTLVNFLIKSQKLDTEFETNILKHQLFRSGGIILFLDGFDEISPDYEKAVISLIKALVNETKVRKVWVTTRPHATNPLEKQFEAAVYQLRHFDEKDRKEFLKNYWTNSLKVRHDTESISTFADKLLYGIYVSDIEEVKELIGVPLQMKMIAEVFADECKAYWESKGHCEVEFKSINVYELFKEFINKKFEIYFREKAQMDRENPRMKTLVQNELKRYKNKLEKMAFRLIFPDDCAAFVKSSKEEIDTELLNVGIIEKRNDSSVFIHRTFAEYFAAEFLSEKLLKDNKNAELIDFLNCNYFLEDNEMIRYFFDHILAEDSEIHTATIENDLNRVKELIDENRSLLLKKDAMGRIPLHLSCAYSTFPGKDNYKLHFPLNNVLDFLISNDVETNKLVQILAKDVLNCDPFAYAYYSNYDSPALHLLNWNYFEYHFSNDLDFNKIGLQFLHTCNIYTDIFFSFFQISYRAEINNMDDIFQNDDFKAIKPYFYRSKEKLRVCEGNNYEILKLALESYFADVFCLKLTDRDYLKELDDELRNLQLCQEWFSEAIQTEDYAFLLGITLACPKTAYILWMPENYIDFFTETVNRRDARLQIDNKMETKCEIDAFFSNNTLKNFLLLAFCELLESRGEKPPTQINCVEYFKRVVMDDYISFKISLKLVYKQDREEILGIVKDAMVHNIILAINQLNPEKLFNADRYFEQYYARKDYEKFVDVHNYMNTDVHATITYMKECLKIKDTTGINLMLSYSICYFFGQKDYNELQNALLETGLIEEIDEFVDWQKRRTEYRSYFFSRNAMKGNILGAIDKTLDHYTNAVSRGYPFSITQHIISQIAWINTKGVPTFIEKHFLRDSDQFPFLKTIIHDVKNGQLKDLLRYFMFANEEQRNAVLKANESELIKNLIKAKCEHIDAQARATNEDSEPRPFMSEEYSNEIINTPEYGIFLLHAFERNDVLMLSFLNIFFKNNAELLFEETAHLRIVLRNALTQMNDKWVKKLFKLRRFLDRIASLSLSDELQIRLVNVFNYSISNFNKIMFRNKERDKYWHPTMYNESFKKAVIEKNYKRLEHIFQIKDYKPEWIKNMKELVELQDYINYVQYFVEKNHWEGVLALLKYNDRKERAEVAYYTGETSDIDGIYSTWYLPKFTELQWQQLIKYVSKFQYGISRGLRCSILKYLDYCVGCISASKNLPKCIICYINESDDLSFVNHVEECIKLKRNGNLKELCWWFYNSYLAQKQEILRANNYEILKDSFRKDYFEELLIYFDEDGYKSRHKYTDIISEKEIFVLDEYISRVSAALKMKNFHKLRRQTEFLCFENNLELCEKIDYENAFKVALKYHNYGVAQLLRVFHSKCDEFCALPEFITFMNEALKYKYIYEFTEITDILSHAQKSKVLKSVDYVNKFKAVLLSRDSYHLKQLLRIYKNENICLNEVFLKVKFSSFLKYCQHFIDKQNVTLMTEEGGERLKSLLDLEWSDASKNTRDTSQFYVNELTVSVEFLYKFPSAARGYLWSNFFYAFCVAICHVKSKPIPRCISIYFEEENGRNPVNYIAEIRKVIEEGYVNESLIWFFMATDEQQKEIFKDDFMKGYFAEIFKNCDFAIMVYFSQEMEAEILSLGAFTDRIADAIKNKEFQYLANVTKCLRYETRVSLWKQTDYIQIHRDAFNNRDEEMRRLIYCLFYNDEKFKKYYYKCIL